MCALGAVALLLAAAGASGEDLLTSATFTEGGGQARTVKGKILVDAQDKSFLLMGRDGRLWSVTPPQLHDRTTTSEPFEPLSREELTADLLAEFGEGFEIFATKNYVICSNAEMEYVQWCGLLFERLETALISHWDSPPLDIHAPEMPLVAIVFADQPSFSRYATKDVGPANANAKGYYSTRTNRIVLYDLRSELNGRRGNSAADIDEQLEASLSNVATVVHEATHQIAFNCGLHTRYADNPLWLTEGMATYFETPDMRNRSGWKTLGKLNPARMRAFREFVGRRRPADSLTTLISSDERLTNAETAGDAYAEAWALTYFLIKTKRKKYVEYLKLVSDKPPLVFGRCVSSAWTIFS
ncbi:MAG: DUF1570 domain-containing protein, partial [Planctomycetaceae bacterium]